MFIDFFMTKLDINIQGNAVKVRFLKNEYKCHEQQIQKYLKRKSLSQQYLLNTINY